MRWSIAPRDSCRTYSLSISCGTGRFCKNAFDDVLEVFTDNFLKPGNLAGGFASITARHMPAASPS